MDVRNFGTTDLSLRLLFVEFTGMAPRSAAVTSEAISVAGGSDWHTIAFDISPSALTAVVGPAFPVADPISSLSNAGELRIFHNPAPSFTPQMNPPIAASLGVDNITAAAIPEPAGWSLVAGGLLLASLSLRRR
jgi:hypothetical protein